MKRILLLSILLSVLTIRIANPQSFVSPIDDRQITQAYADYGQLRDKNGKVIPKYHTGMDMGRQGIDSYKQRNEQVKAVRAGKVYKIFGIKNEDITNNLRRWNRATNNYTWTPAPNPGSNHGLGICVIIYHADLRLYTLYGHLDAVATGLTVNDNVSSGQVIGLLGNSHQQFLRRCQASGSHDHQALCIDTAADARLVTITRDSSGFPPHLHFEVKDRGILSGGKTDSGGPWGYTPGNKSTNMPGHPNWFGYHDPNIFFNLSVQTFTEPVPIQILEYPLNVRSYPSTSPPTGSLPHVITSIAQRSDGNMSAFVAMRSVGNEWYQIYLPNSEAEGWSASGWIAGTLDSTQYSRTNETLTQVRVTSESARVREQPQSESQTLVFVYGQNQEDQQRFVPFETTTGWYRIYLPEKSPQRDGWISSSDVQLIDAGKTQPFNLPLSQGWQMISLPFQPEDTALGVVLSTIAGNYNSVWAYDSEAGGWLRYHTSGADFLNTLTDMTAGRGYWIDVISAATLSIKGTTPSPTIPLKSGWNLVGYNSLIPQNTTTAISSVAGKYDSVWTYNSTTHTWLRHTQGGPDFLNNLNTMEPGRGYWIYALEDTIWDIGGVAAAPLAGKLPRPKSKQSESKQPLRSIPSPPYTLYGAVHFNNERLTAVDGSVVSAKLGAQEIVRYKLGAIAGYGGNYILEIPLWLDAVPNGVQAGGLVNVYVNGVAIGGNPVVIGRPGGIKRLDINYRVELDPEFSLLGQNYPNPFNPETWIPYRLVADADVTLTIYDTAGRIMRTFEIGHKPAAVYESKGRAIYWDGRNDVGESVASGIYFYRIHAGDFAETQKMTLIR